MTQPSALYQLIDSRLDGGLSRLIEQRRPAATWQEIADEIGVKTGLTVTRESLRQWFAGRIELRAIVRDAPTSPASAA